MSGPSHSSTLSPRAGFHPTLRTTVTGLKPLGISKEASPSTSTSNSSSSCSLHLLYSLSPSIILDQYQLRQLHNEGRLVTSQRTANVEIGEERKPGRPISAELYLGGQLDLEAPVSTIDPSLNAYAILSIPLTAPIHQNAQQLPEGYEMPAVDVDVDLPLHLRYQEPVLSRWLSKKGREGYGGGWWTKRPQPDERQDIVDVEVAWPCVFWACETQQPEAEAAESPYLKMDSSSSCIGLVPGELRSSLPKDSPFHPSTTHTHHYLLPHTASSSPSSSSSSSTSRAGSSFVSVPTGVLGDLWLVSSMNLAVTWLGFVAIAWTTMKVRARWDRETAAAKASQEKKQEKKSE